jgi:ubiquinone/menaquinone biosynthesis C-methylase UbiE
VDMERRQRDHEAERYDRLLALRLLSLAEIPVTLGPMELSPQARVVEIGCGTGRFTTRLQRTGAAVIAVDHSLDSLRVLRRKLSSQADNAVQLVQAEAARLPVTSGWATHALAAQVLEHLPCTLRERAAAELARVLLPEGRIAVSVYWHAPGLRSLLAQDGWHSAAIPFHRFSRPELAGLLRPSFRIDRLTGCLIYLLLAHGRKRPPPLSRPAVGANEAAPDA